MMKKLASAVALSALAFVASPALAGEAMQLTDTQMDRISAGHGSIDVRVPIIRNNVAYRANTVGQLSGDTNQNNIGGVVVQRYPN